MFFKSQKRQSNKLNVNKSVTAAQEKQKQNKLQQDLSTTWHNVTHTVLYGHSFNNGAFKFWSRVSITKKKQKF